MKTLFFILAFFLTTSNIYAIENFDINLSKHTIEVGDIFSGKSVKIYGLLDEKYNYVIISELLGSKYSIKPQIKNKLGLIKTSNKSSTVEYFGFLKIISEIKNHDKFLSYKKNQPLDTNLTQKGLMNIENKKINIKQNGLFSEKILIPKTARSGKYLIKIFALDKKTQAIYAIFSDNFRVVMRGDGSFIKDLSKKEKTIYTILSISITIGIACIVSFLLDFYKISFKEK